MHRVFIIVKLESLIVDQTVKKTPTNTEFLKSTEDTNPSGRMDPDEYNMAYPIPSSEVGMFKAF
jgi:hypothetical protein